MRHISKMYLIIAVVIIVMSVFTACSSKPVAGELMMDVTGESFPIKKAGTFSKNYNFWVFNIKDITATGNQTSTLRLKGSELQTITKGLGFVLEDPAGYEWNVVSAVELQWGRKPDQTKKERYVVTYTFAGRMEEKTTKETRKIWAEYTPAAPGFDGSFRGDVSDENNKVIYTFESNPRLDMSDQPDEGLQVFSVAIDGTNVAVLDSRNGYEVTFFEGLQPTQRTQLASTLSSLFVLMEFGKI